MGSRYLTKWIDTTVNNEYKKNIADIESNIRVLFENITTLVKGTGAGELLSGQYWFDDSWVYVRCSDEGDPNDKTMMLKTYFVAFGAWANQSEIDNNEMFQVITPTSDFYLKCIKSWFAKKGAPIFSGLSLEIWSENNGLPYNKLLTASINSYNSSEASAADNALCELYFNFNNYPMKGGQTYCIVMKVDGTFSTDEHLSWQKMDLTYKTGITLDRSLIQTSPYRFVAIGKYA
jgi:hypothetical protein